MKSIFPTYKTIRILNNLIKFLAIWTKMGAALTHLDALNHHPANRTGLAVALIHSKMILKIAAAVDPVNTGAIPLNAFF